jgi:hypothetical protein
MWQTAKKYETTCILNDTNTVISEQIYEAINKKEAEARAYLNCVKENSNNRNVKVTVKKLMH